MNGTDAPLNEQWWLRARPSTVISGLSAALLALTAYLPTVAPTISWRNGGADSGDLAAAVMTLGIPHPPGYPTYVVLGWLWTALPLGGELAYRLNLLSAVSAALVAGCGAATVAVLGRRAGLRPVPVAIGGALGGLAFGLAPLTWSQATITEVYAPGVAVLGALSLLLLSGLTAARRGARVAAGLLGGLGLGVLPQLALVGPGALLLLVAQVGWRRAAGPLVQAASGAVLGVAIFAVLPWRAAADPFMNWGNPTTPERFWSLVSAESYQHIATALSMTQWLGRVGESVIILGDNLGWLGLALGAVGISTLTTGLRATLIYLTCLIGLTVAFRAAYPADGNVVYLLPALYGLAMLAGLGVARLLGSLGSRGERLLPGLLAAGLFGLLLVRALLTGPAFDVSGDYVADDFGRRVLRDVPPHALVVSEHDETTFALWYRQAAGERPDVVVIDGRLLTRDWYRAQLVRRYPDLDPAAVRPGGLTALGRPVYTLIGEPAEAALQLGGHPAALWTLALAVHQPHQITTLEAGPPPASHLVSYKEGDPE
jgi:hypothetical protein